MAAKSAIGMRRNAVLDELVALLGEGFILPTQGHDPDLLYVIQLEAIRDHLKTKAEPQPVETALTKMQEMEPVKVTRGNTKRR